MVEKRIVSCIFIKKENFIKYVTVLIEYTYVYLFSTI